MAFLLTSPKSGAFLLHTWSTSALTPLSFALVISLSGRHPPHQREQAHDPVTEDMPLCPGNELASLLPGDQRFSPRPARLEGEHGHRPICVQPSHDLAYRRQAAGKCPPLE